MNQRLWFTSSKQKGSLSEYVNLARTSIRLKCSESCPGEIIADSAVQTVPHCGRFSGCQFKRDETTWWKCQTLRRKIRRVPSTNPCCRQTVPPERPCVRALRHKDSPSAFPWRNARGVRGESSRRRPPAT